MREKITVLGEGRHKRCPFCGAVGELTEEAQFLSVSYWLVSCSNTKCDVRPRTQPRNDAQKALELWDTRAADQSLAGVWLTEL